MTPLLRRLLPLLATALLVPALALAAPQGPTVDTSGLSDLLRRYTVVVSRPGEPYDTRFDYEQLYVDERIYGHNESRTLSGIRDQLLSVDPADMSPADRTAWALNLYRFMVIERITLHLLVPNRKFLRYQSVDQMAYGEGRFFDAPVLTLDGRTYSLDAFERRMVYGDTATDLMEPRARAGDPRLMFALSRGIAGGPPPLPWVFSGDSLSAQLDRATRIALALPRIARADESTRSLRFSEYVWPFRADYGGALTGLKPLAAKLGSGAIRSIARDAKGSVQTFTMPVDRQLDQVIRPKPVAPVPEKANTTKS